MVRTFHLGLVVFVVALLTGTIVELTRSRSSSPAPIPAAQTVTVVDVAHGVDASALSSLVRLAHDERVLAVGEKRVANDLAAGAAIAQHDVGSGRFLDLTVGGARGTRRVLVLMH